MSKNGWGAVLFAHFVFWLMVLAGVVLVWAVLQLYL